MPQSRRLVLASTSRYRRELLQRLGLPFEAAAPHFDETPIPGEHSAATALRLATGKAESLVRTFPDALIIGADQVASSEGSRMGKPGDHETAVRQLRALSGKSAQLSMSELDALRQRLAQLWTPPAGAKNPQEIVVQVRMLLKPDGTLAAPPMATNSGSSALFMAARDSAMRAVLRGQPYDMLKPEHYEQWKDIEITFDPRDMLR